MSQNNSQKINRRTLSDEQQTGVTHTDVVIDESNKSSSKGIISPKQALRKIKEFFDKLSLKMSDLGARLLNRKRREKLFIFTFLLFPILQFIVFWIIVNFKSIFMAFADSSGVFDLGKTNWEYFLTEWHSESQAIQVSIKNSFIYFGVSNFILLPLTVLFAYLLYKKCFGHQVFRIVFFLPSIIGSVVYCTLFRFFVGVIGPTKGPLLEAYLWICKIFGQTPPSLVVSQGLFGSSETAFGTIMIQLLWTGMGIGLILMAGGLARIPVSIFESAKIDGVNMWQEFWHIVCPLLLPTINSVFTLGMAGMFIFYMPVMLMTEGAADTSTIGWYLTRFTLDRAKKGGNLNYPAFVGLLSTVAAIPFVLGLRKAVDAVTPDVSY